MDGFVVQYDSRSVFVGCGELTIEWGAKTAGAIVDTTGIFNGYVHFCEKCGYTIMESEWEKVE